jgi:hypothetical protein
MKTLPDFALIEAELVKLKDGMAFLRDHAPQVGLLMNAHLCAGLYCVLYIHRLYIVTATTTTAAAAATTIST